VKRILAGFIVLLVTVLSGYAQKSAPPAAMPPPTTEQSAEFLQAADEVLAEMSKLLSLPILSPLKKSLRSRDEIKAYLLQKMNEDKDAAKRYADQKSMEKFGLLPKDYPLEQTLVKVLTEQIAGLYDPDSKEFFIANWNTDADVRMVMSHELTHALHDQHFHIDSGQTRRSRTMMRNSLATRLLKARQSPPCSTTSCAGREAFGTSANWTLL